MGKICCFSANLSDQPFLCNLSFSALVAPFRGYAHKDENLVIKQASPNCITNEADKLKFE